MIRYLVGVMVAVSENRFSVKHFKTLLHEPQKNVQIHRAPACGLQLLNVNMIKNIPFNVKVFFCCWLLCMVNLIFIIPVKLQLPKQ